MLKGVCGGHWLLMNSENVFLQLKQNMKRKKKKSFIFLIKWASRSKSSDTSFVFWCDELIDCDFFFFPAVLDIYYFFTLQPAHTRESEMRLLPVVHSCFCLNHTASSQWWDAAEIVLLWCYWLIVAFSVIICVGTYSNRNAQIIIKRF